MQISQVCFLSEFLKSKNKVIFRYHWKWPEKSVMTGKLFYVSPKLGKECSFLLGGGGGGKGSSHATGPVSHYEEALKLEGYNRATVCLVMRQL